MAISLACLARSRDLYAAIGLEKDVAEEEKMIARVEALSKGVEGGPQDSRDGVEV